MRREALVAPEQPQQTEPHAPLARERAPAHLVLPLRLLVLRQLVQLKVAHDARDGIEDPLRLEHDELAQRRIREPDNGPDAVEEVEDRLHLALEAHPT